MPTDKETFCRVIRARSYENREAIKLLHQGGVTSQIISILRQELDSMVRLIYLLNINDRNYRDSLINATLTGRKWTKQGSQELVTDSEMVHLASSLHGWTKSVYTFGCAFIHLSNFHDYNDTDPWQLISAKDKRTILTYMHRFHQIPGDSIKSFKDLVPHLPKVFEKIASNIEYEIRDLASMP
jgi:hypothetical protein